MDYFESLLEGCKFEIISKTTPADAVRSIILSKGFKSVAESDEIWRRFLPRDYQEIIDRSEFLLDCNPKKELFCRLYDSPILLDGGKLSFFLHKHSEKKYFIIAPRELIILDSDDAFSWQWGPRRDSKFSEVAYLIIGNQLYIRGIIGTEMLSPKTEYNAYLVFKLVNMCDYRLEYAKSRIRFANTVHLPTLKESGNIPKMRGDGWMEVKLGYFDSKKGTYSLVEARLFEMNHIYKGGLIVEGVEFRPK
ncbi:hypothetical protein R3W88_027264 [Solanum pinnatisectum]|uniref:Uncharacterized protein n=1 Tax=Solanum pinnatisectum TaxID=50273 RepID=A0AAV9LI19_9SOLN|nr:hypothetical protein R3W88_027264 [Solanum pinnatisectum]